MPHFSSYEERNRQRAALFLTSAAAVVGGVAVFRRQLGQGAMQLLERAGAGVAHTPALGIQQSALELRHMLEHRIPGAIQKARGAQLAEAHLSQSLIHRFGMSAAEAQRHARQMAENTHFRNFLVSNEKQAVDLFQHQEVGQILDQLVQHQENRFVGPLTDNARRRIRDQTAYHLSESLALSRNEVPALSTIEGRAHVGQARQHVRDLYRGVLNDRASRPGLGEEILGVFGIRKARFGDLGQWVDHEEDGVVNRLFQYHPGAPQFDRLDATGQYLKGLVGEETLQQARLGGLYRVGERFVDLRATGYRAHQGLNWLKSHVQVPLAPGAMGINPFQLLPWTQGKLTSDFGHVAGIARDPALRQILGGAEEGIGEEVFRVGKRLFSVNVGNEQVRLLEQEGGFRSGLYGFARRRAEALEAARHAQAAGGGPGLLGLGKQADHSMWDRIRSVWTKYRSDSGWAPRVFQRLLDQHPGASTLEDLHRAAGFLTSKSLDPHIQETLAQELTRRGVFAGHPELRTALTHLDSDAGVMDFLRKAAQVSSREHGGGTGPAFESTKFREILNQYKASPGSVYNRFEPASSQAVFGWNFLGTAEDRHAPEIVRSAILDELIGQYTLSQREDPGAFLQLVRGLDLSEGAKTDALAYGYGKGLRRLLRPNTRPGHSLSKAMEEATAWLQGDPGAREALEAFSSRHTRPWNAHMESHGSLRTGELFSQRGYGFLEEFNRHRQQSSGWAEAMHRTFGGRWGKQYSALYTGNQADATDTTAFLEYFPRKLNDYFSEVGLGLDPRDSTTFKDLLQNLLLKRALPVAGAVEAYRYADYKAEEYGVAGPSDLYANVRGHLGQARARHLGKRIFGVRRELLPGLEKMLPDRGVEEERAHQESGYEPMRKGRFWFLGSRSEFFGDKIDYFLPSAVQAARSGWQRGENADLATRDYWRHSFLPNPENHFLGPLGPGLWDPYWWEKKHSSGDHPDRPYLQSGEFSDPYTLHGPLVNMTLGGILKPQKNLYPEYTPRRLGGNLSREELRGLNEAMRQRLDARGTQLLVAGGPGGGGTGGSGLSLGSPGVTGTGTGAPPGSLAEITPAGQLKLQVLPGDLDPQEWGQLGRSSLQKEGYGTRLSKNEIARLNRQTRAGVGGLTNLRSHTATRLSAPAAPFREEELDLLNYEDGTYAGLTTATDVMGLYGWGVRKLWDPRAEHRDHVISSATRAYGWERRFYDQNVGGLGGPLSEVGRRFLTRRGRVEDWNPVRNTMPGWLPGSEYFLDLQHGDPYTKLAKGEMRLPGESYERLHGTQLMQTRASSLGKTPEEIMRGMLFLQEPMSAYGEEVTQVGTAIHRQLQQKWKRMGVLLAAENRLYNPRLGISGHFDAILRTPEGPELLDIKTVSAKRYAESLQHPFDEHVTQVNYYLNETGINRGSLLYVNRDAPWEVHRTEVRRDRGRYERDIAKVQAVRAQLGQMLEAGQLTRGDLYDPVTRFEILADVAPYSENYAQVREYLTEQHKGGDLSDPENARFQAAKKRVAQQKRRVQLTPYRFQGTDLVHQTYTVDKILDPNTFTVKESDNPIRLAGLRSSNDRIQEVMGATPEGMTTAQQQFAAFGIQEGGRVKVMVEGDPERRIAQDTLKTQHAVVFGKGGNVNRQLIDLGIGTEKETDWSDTGIGARFTPGEAFLGKVWERFAHLDTPAHNKLLRVRSPLEELERGIVFGKNTGGWDHPFRDYVWPTVESATARHPLIAGATLGAFATLFLKTTPAKKYAGAVGAALGTTFALSRVVAEKLTGRTLKPERTVRREELEEYWDILKYVKYRHLAEREAQLAREQEGVDVPRMVRELHQEGEQRKKRRYWLERVWRDYKTGRIQEADLPKDAEGNPLDVRGEIDRLGQSPGTLKLGPHATKSLAYHHLYRSTLYGIEPGKTPFLNIFAAMPKYKRELVQGWIEKSNARERKRIFDLLPRQEQRVLGKYLGVDKQIERPKLRDFFKAHPLPGKNWKGWDPRVNLDNLRMQAIRQEGLDPMESGIYELQIDEAEERTQNIPVPTLEGTTQDIQRTLNDLLSGRGLQNVRVSVDLQPRESGDDHLSVYLDLQQKREQDLRNALQYQGV
jgi:hypothetical protein